MGVRTCGICLVCLPSMKACNSLSFDGEKGVKEPARQKYILEVDRLSGDFLKRHLKYMWRGRFILARSVRHIDLELECTNLRRQFIWIIANHSAGKITLHTRFCLKCMSRWSSISFFPSASSVNLTPHCLHWTGNRSYNKLHYQINNTQLSAKGYQSYLMISAFVSLMFWDKTDLRYALAASRLRFSDNVDGAAAVSSEVMVTPAPTCVPVAATMPAFKRAL